MFEEEKGTAGEAVDPAQTSGEYPTTALAGSGQNGDVNDATFVDPAAGEGTPLETETQGKEKGEGKKPQSKDTNAEYARKRREAERQRELTEVRNQAIIEALGGRNPYTDGEIKDADDVAEFLAMREIEKKGGDPVADYSKHVKEQNRAQRAQEHSEKEQRRWYESDRAAFAASYPDVNVAELIENEAFARYAEGKVGRVPLADIYTDYLKLSNQIEERIARKSAQAAANAKASPGALSGAGRVESDFFTRDQVKAMSAAQIKTNYEKIRKSMAKW